MEGEVVQLGEKRAGYRGIEIAEFLGKDQAAVKGYLRRGQDLPVQMERLLLHLESFEQNLNH
jgi:predicted transcriptional regulator